MVSYRAIPSPLPLSRGERGVIGEEARGAMRFALPLPPFPLPPPLRFGDASGPHSAVLRSQ